MLLYLVRILNNLARLVETERQRLTKKSEKLHLVILFMFITKLLSL